MKDKGWSGLEFIVLAQLMAECIDLLPADLNRRKIKKLSGELIRELDPLVQKEYDKIFNVDQEVALEVIYEYHKLVQQIKDLDLMEKVNLSQLIEAASIDRDTMLGTAHRVIKKNMKSNGIL